MKAPAYREHVHHVRTERGVSTYQIRTGAGQDAEVKATVVVTQGQQGHGGTVRCVTCGSDNCPHVQKIKLRISEADRA